MPENPEKDFREHLVKFYEMLDNEERDPDKLTKEIATAKKLAKKLPGYGDDISSNIGAALRKSAKEYAVTIEKKGFWGTEAADSVSSLFKKAMIHALHGHDTEDGVEVKALPHDLSNALYVAEKMSLDVETPKLDEFKAQRKAVTAPSATRPSSGSDSSSISADGSPPPKQVKAPEVRAALSHPRDSASVPRHVSAVAGMGRNPLAVNGVGGRKIT